MQSVMWKVSGQIDGGKRVEDEISAPEVSSRDYLLHRFLARHKSLNDYWLSHNQGFVVTPPSKKSTKLPGKGKPQPRSSMADWPAVRPGWRDSIKEFIDECSEGQVFTNDSLLEVDYGLKAAVLAPNGKVYVGHNHLHAYLDAAKNQGFARLGIANELAIQDDDWNRMSENSDEGFLHIPTNHFYTREEAYELVQKQGHEKLATTGVLDSEDLKESRFQKGSDVKLTMRAFLPAVYPQGRKQGEPSSKMFDIGTEFKVIGTTATGDWACLNTGFSTCYWAIKDSMLSGVVVQKQADRFYAEASS